ncbi:MAG: sugar phosphate isomerase/epimerase [Planctomycetota bacterium]|nr:MAG: sugar phosphate isomerase/epimerase [Planctomycetota bacterium]
MPIISAFADEIDADPKVQMDVLEDNGVKYIDLRGAYGENVMKFSKDRCGELKKMFGDRGFGIACIGSPIGKIRLDEDLDKHFDDFKHAVDLAEFFKSKYIRIFSFYPPEGEDVAQYRGVIVDRLAQQVDYVSDRDVILVLENESNLFGAYPERCVYLFAAIKSDKLVGAFDPANFVVMDVKDVYKTCWLPLRDYNGYFHIKDFVYGEKEHAVPAGEGDGNIPEILRDAADRGYDGFLTLEPHLAKAEHSSGVTGPALFKVATDALKKICADVGWKV